ncbi:MAG: hypothetical protein MJ211_10975 [Bacteroidales bacterium]|nr:hypothetical protein [Bacteroidales bacterium]
MNAIVTMPCVIKDKVYDIHMFDCLSEDWGGEGDANEIAEELRSSRKSDWNVESW